MPGQDRLISLIGGSVGSGGTGGTPQTQDAHLLAILGDRDDDAHVLRGGVLAGDGGRPVRSKDARRNSATRSASPAGFRPFAAQGAAIKRSMSVRGQLFAAAGTAGFTGGTKDQNFFPSSMVRPTCFGFASAAPAAFAARATGGPSGEGAPRFTHSSRSATSDRY